MIRDDLWVLLKEMPKGEMEPILFSELMLAGQEATPQQIAMVLQKAVRYGHATDFMVAVLDSLVFELSGNETAYEAALNAAAKTIEARELNIH